jgi:hypothetical protein
MNKLEQIEKSVSELNSKEFEVSRRGLKRFMPNVGTGKSWPI